MKKCGIYKITNLETGKIYIGRSIDIDARWKKHKSNLRNGKHVNKGLQSDYKKYGESAFEFEILKLCDPSILAYEELFEIYWHKPDIYNELSAKDELRYEIYNQIKSYDADIIIEIDYTTYDCVGNSGQPLKWALKLEKDNQLYFIHIANSDFDNYQTYDEVRNDFIVSNEYGYSYITYSADDCDFDIDEKIETAIDEVTDYYFMR